MAGFNLADYQTVQQRIEIFWRLYPEGRIFNDIVLTNEKEVIIKCSVWKDRNAQLPDATDFAQEPITEKGINSVSAVENCATSATGRALSLLGGELSPSKARASQAEMLKAARSRDWLFEAKKLASAGNISGLRKLNEEANQLGASSLILDEIVAIGKALVAKENTPAEKEQTAEVQA